MKKFTGYKAILLYVILSLWAYHVVWTITILKEELFVMPGYMIVSIMGSLIPPFGAIHSLMLIFG